MRHSVHRLVWLLALGVALLLPVAAHAQGGGPIGSRPPSIDPAPPPIIGHPWPKPDRENEPGQLLVKFKPGLGGSDMAAMHTMTGASVLYVINRIGVQVVAVPPQELATHLEIYRRSPLVEYAEPNYLATINPADFTQDSTSSLPFAPLRPSTLSVSDPRLGEQWALSKMQVPNAWDYSTGNPDVLVAVLDTGADFSHPDLAGKLVPGYDFVNQDDNPQDDHGHGTHVSGIIAAATNNGIGIAGVSYNTRVLVVKILNAQGVGTHADIAQGIIWAADHGARVINMSLGGTQGSQTLQDAVNYAWDHGVVIVAAAGNSSTNTPSYPGAYENAIAVAATDQNDGRASFTNYGSFWVDVAAPGVGILSTIMGGSYASWSGTSMATPNVSGVAALIIAQAPGRSNADVRYLIEHTADQISGTGIYWRWGRVNAYRALTGSGSIPTATPPPAQPSPTPGACTAVAPLDFPSQVVEEVNRRRAAEGLPAFQMETRLMRAAQKHSDDMAANNFLSHTGSDGSSPWDRIKRENYPLLSGGETVAGGQPTPADVVTAWMNSRPHREILMGQYRDIGAGYAFRAGTDYGHYWTIDVGVSSDEGQRPLPSPTPTVPKPPPCPTATPTPYVPPTRTPTPTSTPTPVNPPVPTATSTTPANTVTLVITPAPQTAGWTMNGETNNHFDDDDLYSGAYGGRLYLSGIQFDLSPLPPGAQILGVQVELTGQTGEYILSDPLEGWKLQLLSRAADDNWSSHTYTDLRNATVLATIPPVVRKNNLGAGTVNTFSFESAQWGELVGRAKLSFRIDGPTSGNAVMSWDTGYGQDSRYPGPKLRIVYVPPVGNNPTQTPVASKTWTPVPSPTATATHTPTHTPVPPSPTATPTRPGDTQTPSPTEVQITLTPEADNAGWVRSGDDVTNHFGDDDMYTGVFNDAIYYGAMQFNLASIPAGAQITAATLNLTGQTRQYVSAPAEWWVELMSPAVDSNWKNRTYADIAAAGVVHTLQPILGSSDLADNKVNTFYFEASGLVSLQARLTGNRLASFRTKGPTAGENNVFSWDSGFGVGGLNAPPVLTIRYRLGGSPVPTSTSQPTATATRPANATPTPNPADPRQQMIQRINQTRTANGVPALSIDPRLMQSAQRHADDMAAHNFFDFRGSDGSTPSQRAAEAGYPGSVQEMLAAASNDPVAIVNEWLKYPSLRARLLEPSFVHLGVGYATSPTATYRYYWVLDLGKPPAPTPTPGPGGTGSLELTPDENAIGWVRSNEPSGNHFGDDDLYTGYFSDAIYHGAMQFSLENIPTNARLTAASVELTGQTVEYLVAGGEWNLRLLAPAVDADWSHHTYAEIHNAAVDQTIPPTLTSDDLGAGVKNTFVFNDEQLAALAQRLAQKTVSFRLDGPSSGDNNVFSWDTGYGEGGLLIKPVLRISYVVP